MLQRWHDKGEAYSLLRRQRDKGKGPRGPGKWKVRHMKGKGRQRMVVSGKQIGSKEPRTSCCFFGNQWVWGWEFFFPS